MQVTKSQLDRLKESLKVIESDDTDIGVLTQAVNLMIDSLREQVSRMKKIEDEVSLRKRRPANRR